MVVFLGIFAVYCMLRVLISDTLYIIERLGFGRNYFLALGIIVVGIILLLLIYFLYSNYSNNKENINEKSNIVRFKKVEEELEKYVDNNISYREFCKLFNMIFGGFFDNNDIDLKLSFDLYCVGHLSERIPVKDIDKESGVYNYILYPSEAIYELVGKKGYKKIKRKITLCFEDTSNGMRQKGVYREDSFKLYNIKVVDEIMSEGKLKDLNSYEISRFLRDNKGLFRLRYIPLYIKGYFGF